MIKIINEKFDTNISIDVDCKRDYLKIVKLKGRYDKENQIKNKMPYILNYLVDMDREKVGQLSIHSKAYLNLRCECCNNTYSKKVADQANWDDSLCDECSRNACLEGKSISCIEHINKYLIYDDILNKDIKDNVFAKSGKQYFFKCTKCGTIKKTSPCKVYGQNVKCNKCFPKGRELTEEKSLSKNLPTFLIWDNDKNIDSPEELFKGSSQKRWFIDTRCGHSVLIRVSCAATGIGCTKCNCKPHYHRPEKYKSLGDVYPEIIKIWDYERNIRTPYDYKPCSAEKVYFKGKELASAISDKVKQIKKNRNSKVH